MKVINKTTKIIGIGETPVLPGEAIPVTDDVAASPMIQHLANIGKIALEPDNATPAKGGSGKKGKGGKGGKSAPATEPPAAPGADEGGGDQKGGAGDGSGSTNGTA